MLHIEYNFRTSTLLTRKAKYWRQINGEWIYARACVRVCVCVCVCVRVNSALIVCVHWLKPGRVFAAA